MEKDSFITIEGMAEGIYKEKGSKFMGFAWPVVSEEEIKDRMDYLRKKYHDARHHCYAWRLGAEGTHFRYSDDGEPTGTGGPPILGQIRSRKLTNVLTVVVRYFGGTLLGAGGLMRAYKAAASDTLDHGKIVKQFIQNTYSISFGYKKMSVVMKILNDLKLEPFNQEFEMNCRLKTRVRAGLSNKFEKLFLPYDDIKVDVMGKKH